jgi:hypothetical protein
MPRDPWTLRACGASVAFLVCVFVLLSRGDEPLDHGDVHTDERAVVGATQFAAVGFDALQWTQVEDGGAQIGLPPAYYYRHPSGGVVALGALLKAGVDLRTARLAPLLATSFGLLGFYFLLRRLSGEGRLAFYGALMLAAAPPYFLLADTFQLYGYAIGAKLWTLALLSDAATVPRGRAPRVFGAAALCCLSVASLGLETMPSVGFFAVLFPLLRGDGAPRRRLLRSAIFGAAVALGMALGWALRLRGMTLVMETDVAGVFEHLRDSVKSRSFAETEPFGHGRGYLADLAFRHASYLPWHLAAAFGALLLVAVFDFRTRCDVSGSAPRASTADAGGVAANLEVRASSPRRAFLLSALVLFFCEALYFAFMVRHAFVHVHTILHVSAGVSAVAIAAVAVAESRIGAAFADIVSRRATTVVVLAVVAASLAFGPLAPYGNLQVAPGSATLATLRRALDAVSDRLPKDAVVVVPTRTSDWHLRYLLALRGNPSVGIDGVDVRRRTTLKEISAEATLRRRPVFALIHAPKSGKTPEPSLPGARKVAESAWVHLFAVSGFDVASLPAVRLPVDATLAAKTRLLSPSRAELDAAGVHYAFLRARGGGFRLHAAPPEAGASARAATPLPKSTSPRRIVVRVAYPRNEKARQPAVVASVAAVASLDAVGDGAASRSIATASAVLRPSGSEATLVVDLPTDAPPPTFMVMGLDVAEGERFHPAARVDVLEIVVEE